MKPRQTLMNNEAIRSVRKPTYSMQRPSILNNGGPFITTSKVVPLHNLEQINESITNNLDFVTRINPNQRRLSRNNSVKADQKSVINTISSFLGAFEIGFQSTMIDIENLPELFKSLKHPGTVSKNLFNPVGAKHTWWQCLSAIKWIGQLAHYYIESSQHVQKLMNIDWQLQNIFVQNFMSGNQQQTIIKLEKYYTSKEAQIQSKIKDSHFQEQNIKMAMENLQKSQKDISWVEEEVKKTQQLQFRQSNLLTNTEQQIKALERQIYQRQMVVKQLHSNIQQIEIEVKRVTRIVQTQTVSVMQVRAMQNQISELRVKNANLQIQWGIQGAQYQKQVYYLLNKFSEEKATLNSKIEQMKKNSIQYNSKQELFELPIQLQSLKEYLQSQAQPSSSLINKVISWNQQTVTYKIRQINSNLQEELKQVRFNLQQVQRKTRQSVESNQFFESTLIQLQSKVQSLNKCINEAKIQSNFYAEQLIQSNTELQKQKQISKQYHHKFQQLVSQSDKLYNTNLILTKTHKQLQQKWSAIYNNMVLNTHIIMDKVNQKIRDQIRLHNEFNANTKGKIFRD